MTIPRTLHRRYRAWLTYAIDALGWALILAALGAVWIVAPGL